MSRPDMRAALHAKGYRPDGAGGLVRVHPPHVWPAVDVERSAQIICSGAKAAVAAKPAIRVPKRSGPNATEQRWKDDHWHDWPTDAVWRYEELSFRLPSGTLFTPDWCIWRGDQLLGVVEVKGKRELPSQARAAHAFKEAIVKWPSLWWVWAKWDGQEWQTTEVLPTEAYHPPDAPREAGRR